MDNNSLTIAGVSAAFTAAAGILYKIYIAINHKRIRSTCCNKEVVTSIDLENTTPPPEIVVPKEKFENNPVQK
jgi:hypothetical protein